MNKAESYQKITYSREAGESEQRVNSRNESYDRRSRSSMVRAVRRGVSQGILKGGS